LFVIEYILGSLFRIAFILLLFVFHPLQIIALKLFGQLAHQKVVHYLNGGILMAFRLAGTSISYLNQHTLPKNRTTIIVANHQSLWDIVGIYWFLRELDPLFVSKIELAKGIPSISYNLRNSGSALINRKDRKQAIMEIMKLGEKAQHEKRGVVIFPEGTRSKDGKLKQFYLGGIVGLLKKCPDSLIIPVAINGTAAMESNKYYRIKMFRKISWRVLEPIESEGRTAEDLMEECRNSIQTVLE